jgi:hypothetical protein
VIPELLRHERGAASVTEPPHCPGDRRDSAAAFGESDGCNPDENRASHRVSRTFKLHMTNLPAFRLQGR